MYKLLTRKNVVLDAGIKASDEDLIYKFDNMRVKVPGTTLPDSVITLATTEEMETLIKSSVLDSHKTIAGEYEVTTAADVTAAMAKYVSGGDLVFTNGRIFNNGNASPGEIFFFIPKVGSSYKAEEIIVGAKKDLIALSNENAIDIKFATINQEITLAKEDIAKKADSTTVTTGLLGASTERDSIIKDYKAADISLGDDIARLGNQITSITDVNFVQNGRIQALEVAEELEDKIWAGRMHGALTMDISHWQGQDGNSFDFKDGNLIDLSFEDKSTNEVTETLRVGNTNVIRFAMGAYPFSAKLDTSGVLTVTPEATTDMPELTLVRIVEPKAAIGVSSSYLKNESDALYATKTELTTLNTVVTGKQDAVDQSINDTQTKSLVGAINNLISKTTQDESLLANLGSLKTTDGDDLSTTTEDIVTGKTLTDYTKTADLLAMINSAIDLKLKTLMTVTFDDASTGSYKIGEN